MPTSRQPAPTQQGPMLRARLRRLGPPEAASGRRGAAGGAQHNRSAQIGPAHEAFQWHCTSGLRTARAPRRRATQTATTDRPARRPAACAACAARHGTALHGAHTGRAPWPSSPHAYLVAARNIETNRVGRTFPERTVFFCRESPRKRAAGARRAGRGREGAHEPLRWEGVAAGAFPLARGALFNAECAACPPPDASGA